MRHSTAVAASIALACSLSTSAFGQGADNCGDAQAIAGNGTFNFDNTFASLDGPPDPLCDKFGTSQIENDVWFEWTAQDNGNFTINTCDQTLVDTKMAIYSGSCAGLVIEDCNDDTCGLMSQVVVSANNGDSFLLRVGTFPGASGGTGTFTVSGGGGGGVDNDNCADATAISGTGTFNFDNFGATTDGPPDPLCDKFGTSQIENDVWFAWTADDNCDYTFNTCDQTLVDTKLALYEGDCNALSIIDCNDDTCGLMSQVAGFGLTDGTTYLLRVGTFPGASGGTGSFTVSSFNCGGDMNNDDCGDCEEISGTGSFNFDTTFATTDGPPDPLCNKFGTSQIENDVWFCWTAPCNGDYSISTCNLAVVDTKIALYDGTDCNNLTAIDCNDDAASGLCGLTSEVFGNGLVGGESYLIRIGSFPGASGGPGQFVISGGNVGGSNYCAAGQNMDGEEASIGFNGTVSVADNNFELVANDISSASRFGLFVFGDTQDQIPFEKGFLCIALNQNFHRLNPIMTYSNINSISRPVDLTMPPADVISAGSTWNFQYWYRDFGLTNFSDGLSICFGP